MNIVKNSENQKPVLILGKFGHRLVMMTNNVHG